MNLEIASFSIQLTGKSKVFDQKILVRHRIGVAKGQMRKLQRINLIPPLGSSIFTALL